MLTRLTSFFCGTAALLLAIPAEAQISSPVTVPAATSVDAAQPPAVSAGKPSAASGGDNNSMLLVQASTAPALPQPPAGAPVAGTAPTTATTGPEPIVESGGVGVREFQGDEVGQVLRLLARQAKINMVVSDQIPPNTSVTMRLEDVTALQAVAIIVKAKGLVLDKVDNVYYIKTSAERGAEPTESDSYQFSYAQVATPQALTVTGSTGTTGSTAGSTANIAAAVATPNVELLKLIKSQLQSGIEPQFDLRTNSVFYRETRSNIDNIRKMLIEIDKPTKQVMIEARLVEVNANPRQSYGINWAGVVGSGSSPQTLKYGGSSLADHTLVQAKNADGTPRLDASGIPVVGGQLSKLPGVIDPPGNFLRDAGGKFGGVLGALGSQFAILSAPQLSITLSALNEDNDAEFLANPRIVTADNLPAKIEIIRAQPVPELAFNAQTAQSVFNGFSDKTFGNTLLVKPSVNKENFITLAVKPIISNKVGDQPFTFQGATVVSPIIDTRSLESNVLIKSGDTLAIGGLMQDEVSKARTKVPVMGDIPVLGYLFQSRTNARVKRNLLVFVTPTIIDQHYGTGLEDQVTGLHHSGEEYADPNGWRNNAKGAVRLVPTSNRQLAADYPKPGMAPAPIRTSTSSRIRFMADGKDRGE